MLVSVDGQALPQQVTLDGHACGVSVSSLDLGADSTIHWLTPCDEPAGTTLFVWFNTFRQVAADTMVAPRLPPISSVSASLYGRRNGSTFTVVTLSHHTFGAHTWIFQAVP